MSSTLNKALFLDRDGVINVERGYVHRPDEFEFVPGIFDLCRAAQSQGYLLVVATNQAGIARGYYSEADFHALSSWMTEHFAEENIEITKLYYCPYHPLFGVGVYKRDSPDRKPNPGMLLQAKSDLQLDLKSSILIGDKQSDIEAAVAAGVGVRILLSSKATTREFSVSHCYEFFSLDDIRCKLFPSQEIPCSKTERQSYIL